MAAKKRTYSLHTLLTLLVIMWPLLLTYIKYSKKESVEDTTYNKPDLTGLVISDEKPGLSRGSWFSGAYQRESDDYDNDHWALKSWMVRANNQLYYDWFKQMRVNGFVIGKEDYIFSESYIFSAFGDDLMKEEKVRTLLEKAKVIQDTLDKKGIKLLLVYAPGKGEYCKEFVQDKYVHPVNQTNHDLYIKYTKQLGLNHLDIYDWFNKLKSGTPYPLFPKFGHHWSYYGACLASDTIIKHIEELTGRDLPALGWNNVDVVDSSRSRDADVLKSMNLLTPPSQNMKLAYPNLLFETDSTKNTTRVLTVSDSYWYDQVYMGIPANCFAGGQFWYYYNKVIPSPRQGEKVEVWQLDLKKEIESNKVIMLLYSDGNLPTFGNAFIPDVYELYTSPKTYNERYNRNLQLLTYAKQVRESPVLLKKATVASSEQGISLDSAIKAEASNMMGR